MRKTNHNETENLQTFDVNCSWILMRTGDVDWYRTASENEHNWMNVSGLSHGLVYSLRVVALDQHGDEMKSEAIQFVAGLQTGLWEFFFMDSALK
jgi:hypothetical protein